MAISGFPSILSAVRVLVLVAGVAGCASATAPDRELEAARQRWADRGPADYRVTIARTCECLPEMAGPVLVEVRGGSVSRRYVATGEAVAAAQAELFPEVPGLFELVADARDRRAARMEVIYDPVLGYPTRIAIDYDATAADDEVVYLASDFQSL